MTPDLTAKVAGQTYDLNDGLEIRLRDYDLGFAAIRRLSQRAPAQVGDSDLGYRMDPRFADIFWTISGQDLPDYRGIRRRFLEVFTPRENDAVQLSFDFGDRVRALDVNLDGELAWTDRVGRVENVSGIFKASDPRLYDPQQRTVVFDLESAGEATSGWAIAWPVPWPIGVDTLNMAVGINYAGGSRLGAPEFPVIRIFGPITDPVVTNETTEEVIDLSAEGGLSLSGPSEWVEIDLASPPRRDAKSIRNQDGDNVDQFLTTDSDLATWHLAPAGEKLPAGNYANGENVIRVEGLGVTSETVATINFYDRYLAE